MPLVSKMSFCLLVQKQSSYTPHFTERMLYYRWSEKQVILRTRAGKHNSPEHFPAFLLHFYWVTLARRPFSVCFLISVGLSLSIMHAKQAPNPQGASARRGCT